MGSRDGLLLVIEHFLERDWFLELLEGTAGRDMFRKSVDLDILFIKYATRHIIRLALVGIR